MLRKNGQRPLESFIVSKRGVAIYNTANTAITSLVGTGTLLDGQIAFMSAYGSNVNKTIITGTNSTVAATPALRLVQGNENTATPWIETKAPLWTRPYEESSVIRGNNRIVATKQPFTIGTVSTTLIGGPLGASGKVTGNGNTLYTVDVRFKGQRIAEFYNAQEAFGCTASVVTPDYTALGYNATQKASHLLESMAYELNLLSSQLYVSASRSRGAYPMIAFAVDSTGVTGLSISSLTTSTNISVVNTPTGVRNVRLNDEQIKSIKAAIGASGANITSAKIVTIDLASAGASGRVVDTIILMSVDTVEAYKDYGVLNKVTAMVNLTAGFELTVNKTRWVPSAEGQGYGKVLDRQYRNTQGQRKYLGNQVVDPIIEFPSPVDKTESYITYVIEHYNQQQVDIATAYESPMKEIVLIPTTTKGVEDSTFPSNATAFETLLNTWLASGGNPAIQ